MNVTNEWSQLKSVIVGIADNAKIPENDISLRYINYADELNEDKIPYGPYPRQVIEEANEDLDIFCKFLRKEGVKVFRPIDNDPAYYNYCPRDSVLVYKDTAYSSPMPIFSRHNEYKSFEHHLDKLQQINPCAGRELFNPDCIGDPNTLALNEIAPAFDAANIIKANDDILYLVSNSGNKKGAEYIQSLLDTAKIHLLENVYSYMHIDSTVAFLRDGLMLLNPDRISSKKILPKPFCDWDVVWAPEPNDLGYFGNYCNASKWVNMNVFSVNENLVVLEEHQHGLRKVLEKQKIECAMLPMRHQRTLGGGFHCVTLDIERETK
jgi:N-dimethylarginine dimethylaminohydrolase